MDFGKNWVHEKTLAIVDFVTSLQYIQNVIFVVFYQVI